MTTVPSDIAIAQAAKLRTVNPKPERTVETLKEDAEWAKHPTK